MKEQIRPIYSELQGYLAQVPANSNNSDWTRDRNLWTQVNAAVEELNLISKKDYSRFRVRPEAGASDQTMYFSSYRASLGGLIARLHAEYFQDEEPPFRNMPSTVINQTQSQTQSTNVLLELKEKILEELPKHKDGTKEKTFLEKMKAALPTLKVGTDVLAQVIKIGSDLGLSAAQIHGLLHL